MKSSKSDKPMRGLDSISGIFRPTDPDDSKGAVRRDIRKVPSLIGILAMDEPGQAVEYTSELMAGMSMAGHPVRQVIICSEDLENSWRPDRFRDNHCSSTMLRHRGMVVEQHLAPLAEALRCQNIPEIREHYDFNFCFFNITPQTLLSQAGLVSALDAVICIMRPEPENVWINYQVLKAVRNQRSSHQYGLLFEGFSDAEMEESFYLEYLNLVSKHLRTDIHFLGGIRAFLLKDPQGQIDDLQRMLLPEYLNKRNPETLRAVEFFQGRDPLCVNHASI